MATTRWGDASPQDVRDARRLLLDAAEVCFDSYGVHKTTVEEIALTAHVGRATVYRYFGGRDEIVLGVALRDLGRLTRQLTLRASRKSTSYTDQVVSNLMLVVRAARERPMVALLFAPDAAGLPSALVGGPEALQAATTEIIEPTFTEAVQAGQFRADLDIDQATEWFIRIIASFVTMPGRSPNDERLLLREMLVPSLLPR